MHEVGLCQAVLSNVEERAGGSRVRGVRLRVGALHRVSPDAFDQNFQMVAEGSPAEGADVEVVIVPVLGACRGCGHRWEAQDLLPLCPACDAMDVELTGGDELVVESLVLDS